MTGRNPIDLHVAGALLVRRGLAMMEAAAKQLTDHGDGDSDGDLAQLTAAAIERGHRVTGDGYVTEAAAADLLGKAPKTLGGWRAAHEPIPWRRGAGGRVEYALTDLAAFLALARNCPPETP